MHFSIPDTEEVKDASGSFTMYNIFVNGVFHCKARYKLLRGFHDELRKEYGGFTLPEFPKKKLLALSPAEVEQRRIALERYIQLVSQDPQISNSNLFNNFLLTAQQDLVNDEYSFKEWQWRSKIFCQRESQTEEAVRVSLDTFLVNGHKITVSLMSTDQTDDVLESIAQEIEIPDDYVHYFGLFLVKKEEDGDNSIVRKLQEFESPYLSLKSASKAGVHRLVVRKSYWDSSYDDDLLKNKVTMNLLYVQANSDMERHWVLVTKEQLAHADNLRKKGSKREFLRFSRTLKYYGYLQFKPCITDYPSPNTAVIVSAGQRELNFRVKVQGQIKEGCFKITRMRCWRITTLYPHTETDSSSSSSSSSSASNKSQLELSFEYLMSRDNLQWISVISDQAMLMSMSLQSMVDELIMKKHNKSIKKPQDRINQRQQMKKPFRHLSRETSQGFEKTGSQDASSPTASKQSPEPPDELNPINKAMDSVKKFSDKLGKGSSKLEESITENDAFEGIGDDDL